jgi:hypothetical protein
MVCFLVEAPQNIAKAGVRASALPAAMGPAHAGCGPAMSVDNANSFLDYARPAMDVTETTLARAPASLVVKAARGYCGPSS